MFVSPRQACSKDIARIGDAPCTLRCIGSTNLQTAKGGRAFTVVTQTDQPVLISVVERDDVETKRKCEGKMKENKRRAARKKKKKDEGR